MSSPAAGPPPRDPPQSPDLLDSPAAGAAAIRGSALRLGGYGLSVAVGVGAMALLFRHLGVDDAGKYVTVIALVGLFGGLSDGGLATIATRELSSRSGADRASFVRNLLGIRIVSTIIGVLLAALFAAAAGYGHVLVLGTLLAGAGFLLQALQLTLTAPLMARLRFGWVAALDFVRQVVLALVIAALVVVGASLLPFFAAPIVAGILVLVLTALLVRSDVPVLPSLRVSQWRGLIVEALPYALAIAVASIYFRIAVILVSLFSTAQQTGYFGASYRVIEVLLVVPQLAIGAAFPILVRAAFSDRERFAYGVRRLFEAAFVFGGWIALCLVLGAGLAIRVVGGSDFGPAAPVLRIQGIAMLASFVAALWGYALVGLRRNRDLVVMSAAPLAVTCVLTSVLAHQYGARGAAVATTLGEVTMALLGAILLARAARFTPISAGIFPRVALAAGAGAALLLVPGLPTAALLVLASIAYFGVLLAVKGIPKELLVELRALLPSAAAR